MVSFVALQNYIILFYSLLFIKMEGENESDVIKKNLLCEWEGRWAKAIHLLIWRKVIPLLVWIW